MGDYTGDYTIGAMKGNTRSLDNGSYADIGRKGLAVL